MTVAPNAIECPDCGGSGDQGDFACNECHGSGVIPRCPTCAELLAALKAISREFNLRMLDGSIGCGTYNSEIANAADAAIAKAEGR